MNFRFLQLFLVLSVLPKFILAAGSNPYTLDTPLSQCPPAFNDALSRQINAVRYRYNVPPIELSAQLSQDAQVWATTLIMYNSVVEKPDNPYGQSAFRLGFPLTQNKITFDLELDVLHMTEAENYNYYMGEPMAYDLGNIKNFAQIVWKATKRFGVGCAASPIGGEMVLFVVLFFDPKGLVEGQFKNNVHPTFDSVRFAMPSYGCPYDFQQNFLRRINADRMMYLDHASNIVLNWTLRNLAQIESDRLSFEDKGVGSVNLKKEYGILTYLKENNGDYQELLPREPLYRWGAKRPEYLLEDGTVSRLSEETWAKSMQMGIGCTVRQVGPKASLYLVFAFAETVRVKKICPTPTPVPTTTTTTTPKPTTTTTTPKPTTTTTTPKPTTTTTTPKPTTTTTTPKPTTTTPKPTTTTTTPKPTTTTTTPKPTTTTTTPKPTTTTPKPTTTTTTPKPTTTTTTPKPTTTTPKPTTTTTTPKPTTTTTTPKPTTTTTTSTPAPKPSTSTTTDLPMTIERKPYLPEATTDASTDPNPRIPDLPVTLQPGTYPPEETTDDLNIPNPPIPDLPVTLEPETHDDDGLFIGPHPSGQLFQSRTN